MTAGAQTFAVSPLYTVLDEAVARYRHKYAIDFMDRRWTYEQLGDLVDQAARGFRQLGVKPGVKVGLCLPNTPYSVICFYAILKAGGTVVNYSPLYVERELRHQALDSETTIMVTLDVEKVYPKVASLLGETSVKTIVVCSLADVLPPLKSLLYRLFKRKERSTIPNDGRHVSFASLMANGAPFALDNLDPLTSIAVLQYTGGTTGVPKGAMLTHANLTANTAQSLDWLSGSASGDDRMMCVLPLFHIFALTVAMNVGLAIGAEMILVPRFEVNEFLEILLRKRPTYFPGVPTLYTAILNAVGDKPVDFSFIRVCMSGGAPLPVELATRFEALSGCKMVEGYGLTETSPVATGNSFSGATVKGSCGMPVGGTRIEIRSLTDATVAVPIGENGEVVIFGPQVMAGYWKNPEATAKTMIDGGLRTGDIGHLDATGYLYLVDRIKDMILCGGFNVYPRTIEEALYRHPAVAEAAVIGIDDPYRGQSPKAFVRLRDGMTVTVEELKAFLTDHLSPIEMPKVYEFRAELPKTAVGKLSKKELIEEEKAKNQRAA